MATTIKLDNTQILGFSQEANYVDGGVFQYGRTINLDITAFIHPVHDTGSTGNLNEADKFKKIDTLQKTHLDEILSTGFVEEININGQTIENVKILSYNFPTSQGARQNHINLLEVTMALQYYEAFDSAKSNLTKSDSELYKSTDFLEKTYTQYFESFSETFDFSISANREFSFNQGINFSLRDNSPTNVDFVSLAKNMALAAFDVEGGSAPKVGYLDSRYANFIRTVKGNGIFTENYDSINNTYSISRSLSLKNGAYTSQQSGEYWSAALTYDVAVGADGSVTITENGDIQGRSSVSISDSGKNEDSYENAVQGLYALIGNAAETGGSPAHARCQTHLENLVQSSPDWVPGQTEWSNSSDLKNKYVSLGRNINRMSGGITYTISYTTNPRMHDEAIFEYTTNGNLSNSNITTVTETGTITSYYKSKSINFDPKTKYDNLTSSADVISRVTPLYESLRVASSTDDLAYPKNLTASSVSYNIYGNSVNYSFTYSDDPSLRDDTYIRKLSKTDTYKMPTIMRSSVIAPNTKQTNYDANQTTPGSKNISTQIVLKRNPSANKINSAHASYLKTASDSVLSTLEQEVKDSAFVTSPQVGKGDLSWFLNDYTYSLTSDYAFNYNIDLGFIDKKGVAAEALEY